MVRLDVVIPVYNGEQTIGRVIDRLLSLAVPPGWQLGVIVCDDGSTDATADILGAISDSRLQTVRLRQRAGRANACNQGATHSNADVLLWLDADCEPVADGYLECLLDRFSDGVDLVYGPITSQGAGFWPRYLQNVELRRAQDAAAGDHALAMTTGNLAVRRALFGQAGGFGSDYRYYGFEDRDLIARLLAQQPAVAFEPGCAVVHDAGNTVSNYCAKMREAARWTAPLFAARHPALYRRMSYARLDPAMTGSLHGMLLRLSGKFFAEPAIWLAGRLVDRAGVPWGVQAFILRAAAAVSYARGCVERGRG